MDDTKTEIEESSSKEYSQNYDYHVPLVPAYVSMLNANTKFFFVPYWVLILLLCIVKSLMLEDGMGGLDWAALFVWVPSEICSIYFGWQMIKSFRTLNSIVWVISSILSLLIEIYFVTFASTVLFLEYVITIIVIIWQVIIFIGCAVAAYIQNKPMKIQPEE